MVKGIIKAAGQAELTAEEKDPAFLALQIRALTTAFEKFSEVNSENLVGIRKAFNMVDVQQYVLQRVARDLAVGVSRARRLQVDGDVTLSSGDLGPLQLREDGTLNMRGYYEDYRMTATQAGPKNADLAVVLWSQGYTIEEAVARASLENSRPVEQTEERGDPPIDPDYDVEHFGGDYVQNHHEQVQESAHADG